MSNTGVLIVAILALAFIVLGVLVVIIFKLKNDKQSSKNRKNRVTIENYARIAANKNSTKEELSNAVSEVIRSFPFPPKNSEVPPKEAKPYLDFVFLIVYHKKSDAKLIAYMSQELKKINPTYKNEIDAYEEEGLKKRKFQPQD